MRYKIFAVIEVCIVFLLMVYLFQFISQASTAMKISHALGGLLLPGYAVLLIISIILYRLRCLDQSGVPFPVRFSYKMEITAQGFIPIFILSVVLSYLDWSKWTGAILVTILELGLLIWFGYLVRNKQPSWHKTGIAAGLLLLPIASQIPDRVTSVVLSIIFFYVFVAFSEEILFRGYIQSRLNSVFSRRWNFFGIPWGWGVIISSILFGLWHSGWQPGDFRWPHVLWTTAAGLILGFVREKSEGVIAPAILHGIMNYGPQAILYYLIWGG